MKTRRAVLAVALVVGLVEAAAAKTGTIPVVVDASTGAITKCGGADVKACLVTAHEGAVVAVAVENALPGLFSYTTTSHERPVPLVSAELATALGLGAPEAAAKVGEAGKAAMGAPPPADSPLLLYGIVIETFQKLLATVNGSYTRVSYVGAREALVAARARFLARLGTPDETSAVAAAVADLAVGTLPSDPEERAKALARREALTTEVSDSWSAVRGMLETAPAEPTSLGPFLVTFREGEIDIVLVIAPTPVNPTGVARQVAIPVRERQGWGWSTSTGFAASGLTDHNFSAKTVTVTPANATEEAVTRRELVTEGSDRLRVQPALFLHLYPFGGGWEHVALTTGASLSPSTNAQIYAGASYRLGRIGTITAGIAMGNVKRQALNIDGQDLGDLDPQQTRRDVFMTRPFIAITARFAGAR